MSRNPSPLPSGSAVSIEDWALLFNAIQLRLSETIESLTDSHNSDSLRETYATMLDCMQTLKLLHQTTLGELDRRQAALDSALQALVRIETSSSGER